MSTLGYNLNLHDTGRQMIMPATMPSLEATQKWIDSKLTYRRVYELGVHFAVRLPLDEAAILNNERETVRVVNDARRRILNEVFGELEAPLRQAITACRCGDERRCVYLLEDVLYCIRSDQPFHERTP